jgi:uncharacterized iron-regulated membrane protein
MTSWQRWLRQPQNTRLRKALFQIHLWSGVGIGLYVLFISVTGSVLVYRNELYAAATPVRGAHHSGTVPLGIRAVSTLMQLHDDLLSGQTGRRVNGAGALVIIVLACTGLAVWWPGIKTWTRGLVVHRGLGWRRFTWELHSMLGVWTLAFTLVFAASGVYLGFPQVFQDIADRIQPPVAENAGDRFVDIVIYWLAYLHFGRINGIGIPCHGPGFCDQATKFVWAAFGLAPAAMFVTGFVMWWNRVVRSR